MPELGRIYWTRHGLRLAYSAVLLWLAASVMTALTAKAAPVSGAGPSVAGEVLRGMFGRVLSSAALPLVVIVVLGIAAAVITGRDARRRDPVRRFTRQWPVRTGSRLRSPLRPPGGAWRPLLPVVQRRLHQPAELRCRLRQVQPCQARQHTLTGPTTPDGTTTAGVPAAVVLRQRGRTPTAPLISQTGQGPMPEAPSLQQLQGPAAAR